MPSFAATGARGAGPERTGASGAAVCAREGDADAKSAQSVNAPITPALPKCEILPCLLMESPSPKWPFFRRLQLHIFDLPAQAGYGDKRSSQ
jgi:hypothetical protein